MSHRNPSRTFSIKRIYRDVAEIAKNPLYNVSGDLVERLDSGGEVVSSSLHVNLRGLQETRFEHTTFHFIIDIPSEYPDVAPTVKSCTPMPFHPCCSTYGIKLVDWTPAMTLQSLLFQLQGFLCELGSEYESDSDSDTSDSDVDSRSRSSRGSRDKKKSKKDKSKKKKKTVSYSQPRVEASQAQNGGAASDEEFSLIDDAEHHSVAGSTLSKKPQEEVRKMKPLTEEQKTAVEHARDFACDGCEHRPFLKFPPFKDTASLVLPQPESVHIRNSLKCWYTRADYTESPLGIILECKTNFRTQDIQSLKIASSSLISLKAFTHFQVNHGPEGTTGTHWFPLYLDSNHASKWTESLSERAIALLCTGTAKFEKFKPEWVMKVIPKIMITLIGKIFSSTKIDQRNSDMFVSLHRMLIFFAKKYPEIVQMCNDRLKTFASSPESRHKKVQPNLGDMLALLMISDMSWDDIKVQYNEESNVRGIFWIIKEFPELANIEADERRVRSPSEAMSVVERADNRRISKSFATTQIGKRLLAFLVWFLENIARPPMSTLDSVAAAYDQYYGMCAASLVDRMSKAITEVNQIADYNKYHGTVRLPFMSDEELTLMLCDCTRKSLAAGYHREKEDDIPVEVLALKETEQTLGTLQRLCTTDAGGQRALSENEDDWDGALRNDFGIFFSEIKDTLPPVDRLPCRAAYIHQAINRTFYNLNLSQNLPLFYEIMDLCALSGITRLSLPIYSTFYLKNDFHQLTATLQRFRALEHLEIMHNVSKMNTNEIVDSKTERHTTMKKRIAHASKGSIPNRAVLAVAKAIRGGHPALKTITLRNLSGLCLDTSSLLFTGLSECPKLESVVLDDTVFPERPVNRDTDGKLPMYILGNMLGSVKPPALTSLVLSNISNFNSLCTKIFEGLKNHKNISEISITNCSLGNVGFLALVNACHQLPNLRKFAIKNVGLSSFSGTNFKETVEGLVKILKIDNLEVFSFKESNTTPVTQIFQDEQVFSAVAKTKNLKEIDLDWQSILSNERAFYLFGSTFASLSSMHALQLSNTIFGNKPEVLDQFVHGLMSNVVFGYRADFDMGNITHLSISGVTLDARPDFNKHFSWGNLPKLFPNLTHLNMSGCSLLTDAPQTGKKARADKVLVQLGETLANHGSIQHIDISKFKLGHIHLSGFLNALKSSKTLQTLQMSECNARVKGAPAIADFIANCKPLQTINVFGNRLLYDGAVSIVRALEVNTSLKKLDMGGNSLPSKAAVMLAQVAAKHPTLIALSLANNEVEPLGAQTVMSTLLGISLEKLQKLCKLQATRIAQKDQMEVDSKAPAAAFTQELNKYIIDQFFELSVQERPAAPAAPSTTGGAPSSGAAMEISGRQFTLELKKNAKIRDSDIRNLVTMARIGTLVNQQTAPAGTTNPITSLTLDLEKRMAFIDPSALNTTCLVSPLPANVSPVEIRQAFAGRGIIAINRVDLVQKANGKGAFAFIQFADSQTLESAMDINVGGAFSIGGARVGIFKAGSMPEKKGGQKKGGRSGGRGIRVGRGAPSKRGRR